MTNFMTIAHGRLCRGRALYLSRDGAIYISRKYRVFRSDDDGKTWTLDCCIPGQGWKPLAASLRWPARLLRHYVAAFEVLADGSRIAVARDGIYRAESGETRMQCVFSITRGSRPLNIAVDGRRVLFGEYGDIGAQHEIFIYVSEDGGKTFEVGHRFKAGDIRHVHGIQVDPHQETYWVLVGDYGPQSGIGALSKDLRHLEWLDRGSQQCRAVRVLIETDRLIYGTDSDIEQNYIVSMDKQTGKLTKLLPVEGSSLYATTFGPARVISTCVENRKVTPSLECSLYVSRNGLQWQRCAVHHKDLWHTVLFQFGTLVLPYSYNRETRGIFSGQAVASLDNRVARLELA